MPLLSTYGGASAKAWRSNKRVAATLDPLSIGGNSVTFALSGGSLIATRDASAVAIGSIRIYASAAQSAGKYYHEAKFNGGTDGGIGLAQTNLAFTTVPAIDSGLVGIVKADQWNGNVYVNSTTASGTIIGTANPHLALNDWVAVAVDLDNKRIWFRTAAFPNWNNSGTANPATNTGGLDISSMTFPLVPWFELYNPSVALTTNFGQSAYVVGAGAPTGFANWVK